jgi:hypothetical protein
MLDKRDQRCENIAIKEAQTREMGRNPGSSGSGGSVSAQVLPSSVAHRPKQ